MCAWICSYQHRPARAVMISVCLCSRPAAWRAPHDAAPRAPACLGAAGHGQLLLQLLHLKGDTAGLAGQRTLCQEVLFLQHPSARTHARAAAGGR